MLKIENFKILKQNPKNRSNENVNEIGIIYCVYSGDLIIGGYM